MPKMSEDQIVFAIMSGTIGAITIDTAVFDKYRCSFAFPVLRKLDQFKDGTTQVWLSEIVVKEVEDHIARNAAETQRFLKKAIRDYANRWKELANIPGGFEISGNPRASAQAQVNAYLEAIGATTVSAAGGDELVKEVLRRYFAPEPPFEDVENKKREFPDAFALLSLSAAADKAQTVLLCVSPDKGWNAFCDASEALVCVGSLEQALSFFNSSGRSTADAVIGLLRQGNAPSLEVDIAAALEGRLDDGDFYPYGSSMLWSEIEPISAVPQTVEFDPHSQAEVIAVDDETVTFTLAVHALVAFEAGFHFHIRGSVDGDTVALGSTKATVEERLPFELVITVARDLGPVPRAIDVKVRKAQIDVNFGDVNPYSNENPYHEKY